MAVNAVLLSLVSPLAMHGQVLQQGKQADDLQNLSSQLERCASTVPRAGVEK
jgi:hypothetical protein